MKKSLSISLICVALLAGCQKPLVTQGALTREEGNMLHLAETMQAGGDVKGAEDLYLRVVAKSTHHVEGHLGLAGLFTSLNQPERAQNILLQAKERQVSHPQVNLLLGKAEIEAGDARKALVYFEDGAKEDSENPDLLSGRGVALDMLERHSQAQEVYRQALAVLPQGDTDFIQNNLAMSYIMSGDYDAAIAQLTKIPGMEQKKVMRQNLALAYGLKGEMEKARQWGLKDLSESEMRENIDFYRAYHKKLSATGTHPAR